MHCSRGERAGLLCRAAEVPQLVNSMSLYVALIAVSIRAQMQYRVSFLLMSFGQFVATGVEALGLWALFARFGRLSDWTFAQVGMFYGVVNIGFALADALSKGFDVFGAEYVRNGNFDRLLLRGRSDQHVVDPDFRRLLATNNPELALLPSENGGDKLLRQRGNFGGSVRGRYYVACRAAVENWLGVGARTIDTAPAR